MAEKLCDGKGAAGRSSKPAGTTRRSWSTKCSPLRAKLARRPRPVEGTGSKLRSGRRRGSQANAGKAPPPLPLLRPPSGPPPSAELHDLQDKLHELQGESRLILPTVDEQAVASVVRDWTGIPVGRMVKNEIETVLKLADTLSQRVIGQRHAMEMIAKRIQTSRAGLDNPNKPIGVFMLAGPSGVGKTETALALAEALYGGEQNLITINMSEFQEAHTVSHAQGLAAGLRRLRRRRRADRGRPPPAV